jgi:uncharacterized protein
MPAIWRAAIYGLSKPTSPTYVHAGSVLLDDGDIEGRRIDGGPMLADNTIVMAKADRKSFTLAPPNARRMWLHAQRLDETSPFGDGPQATRAAVEHLGYVQIDTINVIERCHHQILYTRIPNYNRDHLSQAQTIDKTVFEYWTHALSYVPTRDFQFYISAMKRHWRQRSTWFTAVTPKDLRKVLTTIREQGPITIRDIDDDVLVEKDHPWASRKPSKRALQLAFYRGMVTISQRQGMLKTYELTNRHFGWEKLPKAASELALVDHLLDRALRSQGFISLESACLGELRHRKAMRRAIEKRMRRHSLIALHIEEAKNAEFWARPEALELTSEPNEELVHILSPFDPLVRQRKRLHLLFGYQHLFEAYIPKEKRRFGYFSQPVLVGDEIAAVLDLKTDRERQELLLQKWTWVGARNRRVHKKLIEEALGRFERFQLASWDGASKADPV